MAKRVAKEMSIGGENYDSSIVPVRSDISRFSRGTVRQIIDSANATSFDEGQARGSKPNHAQPGAQPAEQLTSARCGSQHWVCIFSVTGLKHDSC